MFIASAATTVKFHEFDTGEIIHNYQPGTNPDGHIRSIALSRDGQWLSVVPYAGNVEIVSIKGQLKLLRTIEAVKFPTCAWFQSSTKKSLAIGSNSGVTIVYDVKTKATKKEFRGPTDEITHVRFTAQDSHCITACRNGTVYVNNCVLNGKPRQLTVPKSKTVTCLTTQPSKKNLVAGGSAEGMVVVWDLNTNRSKFQTMAHQASVNCVSFSPKKPELVSTAGQDRHCYFFDTNNGKQIANVSLQNSATSMDFTSDGQHFVLGHQNGQVSIYDLRNIVKPLRTYQAHNKSVKHLFCQPIAEQSSNQESDISIEATPVKRLSDKIMKANRCSDLFSVSFASPDMDNSKLWEGAKGTPPVFRVDNCSSLSSNKDMAFCEPSPDQVRRMSVGEFEGKIGTQFFSTPKTAAATSTTATAAMISTSTQTDNFDKSSLEDFKTELVEGVKNELQSIVTDLKSTMDTNKWEGIFELRDLICRSDFHITKNFVELMDSVENIQVGLASLAQENVMLRQRLEELEDQFRMPNLM